MLVPILIISVVLALVYPFLRWNHRNGAPSGYGPYQFIDNEKNEKVTVNGTITFKEKEKPLTSSQKMRRNQSKRP